MEHTRLQLIKPWRLRAVRQKLDHVREQETVFLLTVPANCPQADEEPAPRTADGRSDNRKKAPVSDVIFASKTTTYIR